jgi:hypothetical protein
MRAIRQDVGNAPCRAWLVGNTVRTPHRAAAVRVGLGPRARRPGWGVADCDVQGFQTGPRNAVGGRIDGREGGAQLLLQGLVALAVRLFVG